MATSTTERDLEHDRPDPGSQSPEPPPRPSRLREALHDPERVWHYFGIPVVVTIALVWVYRYTSGLDLGSIEARYINSEYIQARIWQHLYLSGWATLWVVAIAVPLGILLTRPFARRFTPPFIALANTGQAIPSVGLLFIIGVLYTIGPRAAIIGVVAYCVLPVLRNTMVGLDQVDKDVIESARGMGMTKRSVLFRIELPLAVPIILTGVRTALILVVGTMVLGVFINAGGLGHLINAGLVHNRDSVLIVGAVVTASIALLIDWAAGIVEDVLRPRGL